MTITTLIIGLLAGGLAIVAGLIPGVFDVLEEATENFRDEMMFGLSRRTRGRAPASQRPFWLAGLGALIVSFTLLAYFLT